MSMVDRKGLANPLTREQQSIVPGAASSNAVSDPLAQYECGRIEFSATDDTFPERRLIFDKVSGALGRNWPAAEKSMKRVCVQARSRSRRIQ
jgi:hypothetical protein